ncbi:GDSL esterase/lipase 1-like [Rhododendron vialii]|uniref:GDSL esterase/lipase 1-like n=1 Tax=Rhododendron vialii TaxID=182163 RepID=UPI00265FFBD7|nr:GDSL esterase/lipase 1-like [Rhododendron vialii]
MALSFMKHLFFHVAIFILFPNSSHAADHRLSNSKKHVALFVFGDSLFDVGNNNYINTTTTMQSNFWPYGETFFNHPTGRASDGRLIPDFIAEYAKLPLLRPYKQPGNNHQFSNGVNFASGGAGALAQINQGLVIDLNMQLIHFKNVKKVLEQHMGETEAKKILSTAVYLFSIGNNDYLYPFLTNSNFFQLNSPEDYAKMVIGNITNVIKEIYEAGGRKFAFVSLAPFDCAPLVRALNPAGECMQEVAALIKLHNTAISKVLKKLEMQLQGFKYSNFDLYNSATERIENPSKYGFEDGKGACCGSGPYRGVRSCGGKRGVKEFELCSNPSEFVYFDAGHPTERLNEQLAQQMWSASTPSIVGPYNLEALFEQM